MNKAPSSPNRISIRPKFFINLEDEIKVLSRSLRTKKKILDDFDFDDEDNIKFPGYFEIEKMIYAGNGIENK